MASKIINFIKLRELSSIYSVSFKFKSRKTSFILRNVMVYDRGLKYEHVKADIEIVRGKLDNVLDLNLGTLKYEPVNLINMGLVPEPVSYTLAYSDNGKFIDMSSVVLRILH